jgi:hypothetical protein
VHHHIVALAAHAWLRRDADNRVGSKIELQLLSTPESRSKRFGFQIEEPMRVARGSGGKDQELPSPDLAPQKVATAIPSIGEQRPDQVVPSPEPCARILRHEQLRERSRRNIAP